MNVHLCLGIIVLAAACIAGDEYHHYHHRAPLPHHAKVQAPHDLYGMFLKRYDPHTGHLNKPGPAGATKHGSRHELPKTVREMFFGKLHQNDASLNETENTTTSSPNVTVTDSTNNPTTPPFNFTTPSANSSLFNLLNKKLEIHFNDTDNSTTQSFNLTTPAENLSWFEIHFNDTDNSTTPSFNFTTPSFNFTIPQGNFSLFNLLNKKLEIHFNDTNNATTPSYNMTMPPGIINSTTPPDNFTTPSGNFSFGDNSLYNLWKAKKLVIVKHQTDNNSTTPGFNFTTPSFNATTPAANTSIDAKSLFNINLNETGNLTSPSYNVTNPPMSNLTTLLMSNLTTTSMSNLTTTPAYNETVTGTRAEGAAVCQDISGVWEAEGATRLALLEGPDGELEALLLPPGGADWVEINGQRGGVLLHSPLTLTAHLPTGAHVLTFIGQCRWCDAASYLEMSAVTMETATDCDTPVQPQMTTDRFMKVGDRDEVLKLLMKVKGYHHRT